MIRGIHHVTALASTPQKNVDFYVGVLGLRLVKKTVNFDDPNVYHLYYGDGVGSPGTLMTFFPYGNILPGKRGTGETSSLTFQVPLNSLDWWVERLSVAGIENGEDFIRDSRVIWALDPDGLRIELEESDSTSTNNTWTEQGVPLDKAIRRIIRVTLRPHTTTGDDTTDSVLTHLLGFSQESSDEIRTRYVAGDSYVDVLDTESMPKAQSSAGTIHHVAFGTLNDEAQEEWLLRLSRAGRNSSPIMERNYFRSIYFREPGGILFELATDGPGFTVDEDIDSLGTDLKLPPQYENKRSNLESVLPELILP